MKKIPTLFTRIYENNKVVEWLNGHPVEGLVFWLNGEPMCKIKRTDFGYEWPVKEK